MIRERPDPKGIWTATVGQVQAAAADPDSLPDPVPVLLCNGHCTDSCGPAPMTAVEFDRVEQTIGRPLVIRASDGLCSALNDQGRCDAYNVRPRICRIWGLSEGMICPHGCRTTTGWYLTYPEAVGLIAAAATEEGGIRTQPHEGEQR